MRCPECGCRPLGFTTFLTTLNPFRITCVKCGAALRAGPIAYIWTALHGGFALGFLLLHDKLADHGWLTSPRSASLFLLAVLGTLFVTAFVIPWFAFNRVYRAET